METIVQFNNYTITQIMKLTITSLFITLLFCGNLLAQITLEVERCGTDTYMEEKMQDPVFKQEFLQQKALID